MASAALKAKTEANAVRFVSPVSGLGGDLKCAVRLGTRLPAAQALREEAQEARAELEEKRAKLIKVRHTACWRMQTSAVVWGGKAGAQLADCSPQR